MNRSTATPEKCVAASFPIKFRLPRFSTAVGKPSNQTPYLSSFDPPRAEVSRAPKHRQSEQPVLPATIAIPKLFASKIKKLCNKSIFHCLVKFVETP
jgi:hypothetical protein